MSNSNKRSPRSPRNPDYFKQEYQKHSAFRQVLNTLRTKHVLTDMYLQCGNRIFPAHKVVLTASSEFFRNVIKPMPFSQDSTLLIDVEPSVMEVLLQIIYTGNMTPKDLPNIEADTLFVTAEQLGIENVPQVYMGILSRCITKQNVVEAWLMGNQRQNAELLTAAEQYILDNLEEMMHNTAWKKLPYTHIQSLLSRAVSKNIDKETLRNIVIKWVDVNTAERSDFLDNLLKTLENAKSSTTSISIVKPCIKEEEKKPTPKLPAVEPESDMSQERTPISFVFIMKTHKDIAGYVDYKLPEDKWSEIELLDFPLDNRVAVTMNKDNIIFVGGEDCKGNVVSTCLLVDRKNDAITNLPNMRIPRAQAQLFVIRSTLYAVGGIGRYGNSLSYAECLELSDHNATWKTIQPIRDKRNDSACFTIQDGRVYIIGGGTSKCEFLQPSSNTWHELPSLPDEFSQLIPFAVNTNGKIYVFNYYKPLRFYYLTSDSDQWKMILCAKGTPPEWVVKAAGYEELIFVSDRSLRLYVYDTAANTWSFLSKFPKGCSQVLFMDVKPEMQIT